MAQKGATSGGDYEWLKTSRVFMLESYGPPYFPELTFDAHAIVEAMKRIEANVCRPGVVGYWAYVPHPVLRPHPDLGGRDLLTELVEAASPEGLKVIPYVPIGVPLPWWMVEDHPEWLKVGPGGDVPRGLHVGELIWEVCPLGPYRKQVRRLVRDIARHPSIAGVYFDGPYVTFNSVCYCADCRRRFRRDTGMEMPPILTGMISNVHVDDWESPALQVLDRWVSDQEVGLLAELTGIVKEETGLPVIFNRGWHNYQILRAKYSDLLRSADGSLAERSRDYLANIENCTMTRSAGRVIWNYVSNYDSWPRVDMDGREVVLEGAATLAGGGSIIFAWGNRHVTVPRLDSPVKEVFEFVAEHEPLLRSMEPVPYAAVAFSERTAAWYGREDPVERYVRHVRGAFALLHDAHLQVTMLIPDALKDPNWLARYPVVILPNTACLLPDEMDALRAYVQGGGGLVATGATSLHDPRGRRLPDFALSDLLGVQYLGEHHFIFDHYVVPTEDCPVEEAERLAAMWPVIKSSIVHRPSSKEEPAVWANLVKGEEESICPAIVARRLGEGRVVYIAPNLTGQYMDPASGKRCAAFRHLFGGLVRWAAGCPPPFAIAAPVGLTALAHSTSSGLAIFLVSRWGDPADFPHSQLCGMGVMPEIALRMPWPPERPVPRARLLRSGAEVPVEREGDGIVVWVPSFCEFEVVVVEPAD